MPPNDADRTEEPTARRKSDARKKGQIAISRELTAAVTLLAGLYLLSGPGKQIMSALKNIMTSILTNLPKETPTAESLREMFFLYGWWLLPGMAFLLFGLLVVGLLATGVQTKFNWAKDNVGLDFKKVRLNPLKFFEQLFSPNGLAELIKSILKLIVIGLIAFSYLKAHTLDLLGMGQMGVENAFNRWAKLAYDLAFQIAIVYLLIGIADYLYQRWNTGKQLKMTKSEVKDERSMSEGNPVIRRALRRKQQQMAMMRMMTNVPKADVVIINPTHLAIAVEYKADMRAPVVLAKGARLVAKRIVKIAEENGIPVVQNIPVARAIYSTVEINQEIPPELYKAVAEILVYVYRLQGKLTPSVQPG